MQPEQFKQLSVQTDSLQKNISKINIPNATLISQLLPMLHWQRMHIIFCGLSCSRLSCDHHSAFLPMVAEVLTMLHQSLAEWHAVHWLSNQVELPSGMLLNTDHSLKWASVFMFEEETVWQERCLYHLFSVADNSGPATVQMIERLVQAVWAPCVQSDTCSVHI